MQPKALRLSELLTPDQQARFIRKLLDDRPVEELLPGLEHEIADGTIIVEEGRGLSMQ